MRIPLDAMMGNADETESSYTKFVVDLRERLIQAHQDVREKLKVAQRRQKDAFDKGVKYTVYQPRDLVLRFSPQLKPGEPNKFHCQLEGPYEIVERVSEVTYRVRRRGRLSRRSSVVHFNNLRLYKRAADVSREHGKPTDSVQNHADTIGGVGGQTSVSDNEEKVFESEQTGDPAPGEGPQETADESSLPGDCLEERVESFLDPSNEQELPDQFSDTSNPSSGFEDSEWHLHQTPRPSPVRKPPDPYGDWLLNNVNSDKLLVELLCRVVDLESFHSSERQRITKLNPKLLKKARVLREKLEKKV